MGKLIFFVNLAAATQIVVDVFVLSVDVFCR